MPSNSKDPAEQALDRRRLLSLGVLLPIRLQAMSFLPGRHPLGRAGEGMRYLRSRPYEPGEDSPRDIDKFSPDDRYWVNEWQAEAQANIRILADVSHSMRFQPTQAIRNLALLQLTYSLWRATDRVRVALYSAEGMQEFAEPNLRSQLEQLVQGLGGNRGGGGKRSRELIASLVTKRNRVRDDLLFVISDFADVDPQSAEEWCQWQTSLRRLRSPVVPVIVSFELPSEQRGSLKLRDPERRVMRLTLLTPSRIERINAAEAKRIGSLENLFRGLGLYPLTLRHEREVYPSLARLARTLRKAAA